MKIKTFNELKQGILDRGYRQEIVWAENIKPCPSADDFFAEYMWVVVSSGMKNQIAELIDERLWGAIREGKPLCSVFRHKGKVKAIEQVLKERELYYELYQQAEDKLAHLESLPYIGGITKYHLAKNLGVDTIKPDRHIERIAKNYGMDCFQMCGDLAIETGLRVATVDQIIWRAANLGLI